MGWNCRLFSSTLRIRGELLTGKWFDRPMNLLYKWSIKLTNKNQIQYLETSLYKWFWYNQTNIFICYTSHQEKRLYFKKLLTFYFVWAIILKSRSGFNEILQVKKKTFFPSNCVKTTGSGSIFYPIHLQLRSSRWHFIIKYRLLFLLKTLTEQANS